MTGEPDYLAQTHNAKDVDAKRDWYVRQAKNASAIGVTWHRFSHHPDDEDLLLYEGWKVRPDDEGPHRFQVTA